MLLNGNDTPGIHGTMNPIDPIPTNSELGVSYASDAVVLPSQKATSSTSVKVTSRCKFAKEMEKTSVWGTDFAQLTMQETVELCDAILVQRRPEYIVTANLNYLMLTDEHPKLHEVNQHAAAVLADGNPIVWRSRFSKQKLPCRVAGSDLIVELAQWSSLRGYRVFFLGGAPGVADAASKELKRQFPSLQIAGCYSPPFRQLSEAEHSATLNRIREAHTDILLVAFGQPKGEFWIFDNFQDLGVPLSIQLGASFDFLAGTARHAPRAWQSMGMEWLYRALSDPKRLLPRYSRNLLYLFKHLLLLR